MFLRIWYLNAKKYKKKKRIILFAFKNTKPVKKNNKLYTKIITFSKKTISEN